MRVSLPIRRRNAADLARLMVLVVVTALLGCVLPQVASAEPGLSTELGASAEPGAISSTPSTTQRYTPCPSSADMVAECNLVIDPVPIATTSGYELPDGSPLLGSGEKGGLDPENLESAYKIPTTGGSSETVALVDAYGDSTAESDLNKYREKYKVYYKGTETACTKTNGCFKKVNVKGEEANYPAAGPEIWGAETALDIEMVSAACPECHILLVEASGEYPAETAAAVEEAAKLKATEISNSYGYSEDDESACPSKKGCKEYLAAYNQGIPVMASAGDGGYDNKNRGYSAPLWPAVSPNVIAVGGTELEKVEKPKEGERGWKEVVWPDSGSGCSLYESEPTWQEAKTVPKACGADRTDNDVASVAEEVSIYTTPYEGGWGNVGGTSASSPFVAGVEAHATSATKTLGADAFYKKPSMLFHISSGSNGSCGAEGSETYYLCHATKEGYNGPTGMGTPDGVFTSTTAPVVTTGSATSVTETGATLNGTVNPEGSETKYAFEYGTTKAYGTKTAEASAGSGTSNVEVSKSITSLAPSATYYFRIVATNSESEKIYGTEKVFSTTGKPSVETKGATSVGETDATLNGVVNPRGSETKYYFEYGTTESYGTKTAEASAGSGTSNVEESRAISGLTASTEYYVRIVATSSKGTTDGSPQIFITAPLVWSVQEPPAPTGAKETFLEGISCHSATACIAVGYFRNSAGTNEPLAESWNGTAWAVEEPPAPSGAKEFTFLDGVSCYATEACIAVGEFKDSSGIVPLAEKWNGSTWTPEELSAPTGATIGDLDGISCYSATACTAAGMFKNSSGTRVPLAEIWNGTKWTIQEPPNPPKAKESWFEAVSCTSSASCSAAGYIENNPEHLLMADGWNGTTWSIQETPLPTEATQGELHGVSCTSATACTAVGQSYDEPWWTQVAERWNGTTWKSQELAKPTESPETELEGVSCTSATACTAVGNFYTGKKGWAPEAEGWNGTEWAVAEPPIPTGAEDKGLNLNGVSCTASMACMAVGHFIDSSGVTVPLVERYH